MSSWRILAAILAVLWQALPVVAQTPSVAPSTSNPTESAKSVNAENLPAWLPLPIPPSLYEKWRKYGLWDYKQQGAKYYDLTQFNFGATGSAAGISQESLLALANASKPNPDDIKRLDDSGLKANFMRDGKAFEMLQGMAQEDSHVIRIASDFTLLDSNSKWPRDDIGFSAMRWKDYRSLFEKLSLSEGIVRTEDFPGAIFLVAHARGLCTGGSSIGYVYSTSALASTAKSPKEVLDAEARRDPDRHYAYVFEPIKPNWYIFYEIDW